MRTRWAFPLLLTACFVSRSAPSDDVVVQRGACSAFEGVTFESLDKHECGQTPDGTALCHWHITLDAYDKSRSSFQWHYSDVAESGTVRCDGNQVQFVDGGRSGTAGIYDAATGELTWDGVVYIHGS